jgi:hypothetical protein
MAPATRWPRRRRLDLLEAKSRIAEALVESIFRRARYQIRRWEADQLPLRFGREDFSPDFRATLDRDAGDQDVLVEVKYRPSIEQFLSVENQRGERSVFCLVRRQWPALYFVLVTDRPEPGRSCFQAVALSRQGHGEPFRALDLGSLENLGIFPNNIEDHEALVRRIFNLLSGA